MNRLLVIGILIIFSSGVLAQNAVSDFAKASDLYSKKEYEKAAELYLNILKSGNESFELYYNIGNCFYKLNKNTDAIVFYEKAKKIKQNDEDLSYNLNLAYAKTIDKIEPPTELFFEKTASGFLSVLSTDGWAWLCVLLLFVASAMIIVSMLLKQKRQLFFVTGFVFLIFTLSTYFLAKVSFAKNNKQHNAIIYESSVTVKSEPGENSTELFVLHEGTRVSVLETTSDWTCIQLPNGNKGWLKTEEIKGI